MQIVLYVLVGWFGIGALGGLTLLGTSIVFRRSELPLPLHVTNAQSRQLSTGDRSDPIQPVALDPHAAESPPLSDGLAHVLDRT